jgi:hypothetical protein
MRPQPKFKVQLATETYPDANREHVEWVTLEDVIPESVSVICPHCEVYSGLQIAQTLKHLPQHGKWSFDLICTCPNCEQSVFVQATYTTEEHPSKPGSAWLESGCPEIVAVYPPFTVGRPKLPEQVPQRFREDYHEASLILHLSPKASATLSRRCLQLFLHEHLGINKRDLAKEIEELLTTGNLPSDLAKDVDAIRQIGNFAAHPIKYTNTGEIAEVEPGEAEWLLGVLEALFDFYFVQPAIRQAKRTALNEKLDSLGKPPLKG